MHLKYIIIEMYLSKRRFNVGSPAGGGGSRTKITFLSVVLYLLERK